MPLKNIAALLVCLCAGLPWSIPTDAVEPKPSPPRENIKLDASWPLFALCMDTHDTKNRSIEEQAVMLSELDYDGCGHLWLHDADKRAQALSDAGLRLFQVYLQIDLSKPEPVDVQSLAGVLPSLKPHRTQLALLIKGGTPSDPSQDDRAIQWITQIADLAGPSKVTVVLYPHAGFWLQTCGDGVRLATKIHRPGEVGVMFNLCHWMRADPQRDVRAVLQQARPWLSAVSLNGTDAPDRVQQGKGTWIQPLGQGNYDLRDLLLALREIAYTGPIGLQCYGIRGDAQVTLSQSMEAWRRIQTP